MHVLDPGGERLWSGASGNQSGQASGNDRTVMSGQGSTGGNSTSDGKASDDEQTADDNKDGEQEHSVSDHIILDRIPLPELSPSPEPVLPGEISFEHVGWPMIYPNIFGGSIQVGVPVTGVINEDRNFHTFTMTIPAGESETFGLTLILTANSDEEFEMYFLESDEFHFYIMMFFDFYEYSDYMEINGRTMTITFPGWEYPEGVYTWSFNCPEYQWGDGPEDPNPSDLKLHFSFLLDPDAECAEPFV